MIDPNKSIYDVYLVSVSEDANISNNVSFNENIRRAILDYRLNCVGRLLVQMTNQKDMFREIITDDIISGCIVYGGLKKSFKPNYHFSNKKINSYAFIKPVYCQRLDFGYYGYRNDIYHEYLEKAAEEQIDEYCFKHYDKRQYLIELGQMFSRAMFYYRNALSSYSNVQDDYGKKLKRIREDYHE